MSSSTRTRAPPFEPLQSAAAAVWRNLQGSATFPSKVAQTFSAPVACPQIMCIRGHDGEGACAPLPALPTAPPSLPPPALAPAP
jgi:hypothetical protein